MNEALELLIRRKNREAMPAGYRLHGVWFPNPGERQACCDRRRMPSPRFPNSLLDHCRTVEHVARLCGVPVKELRRAYRAKLRADRESRVYYKVVAVENGVLKSIFDGSIYELGKTRRQTARQGHASGFYVYGSLQEAREANRASKFPISSRKLDSPRAIIACKCGGAYCVYDNGKIAFSRITPVEIVEREGEEYAGRS